MVCKRRHVVRKTYALRGLLRLDVTGEEPRLDLHLLGDSMVVDEDNRSDHVNDTEDDPLEYDQRFVVSDSNSSF